MWNFLRACAVLPLFWCGVARAGERASLNGRVTDAGGAPVNYATVVIYEAGVKHGYSTFCSTCYVDCGKRAVTDAAGVFTFGNLSPDLWFTLLVVHDGHSVGTVRKADPAKSPAETVVLKARAPIEDVSRLVRGRVVDGSGRPLPGAVVSQEGAMLRDASGRTLQRFGDEGWTDPIAVSNERGEFEIAYDKPAEQLILSVAARGMAARLFTEPTGAERRTMTVEEGATVRGRLMHDGKPVANAQVGLMTHNRRSGTGYPEIRIGTQEDGTFAITNVPAGRVWTVYPKMESLAARGLGGTVLDCETKDSGQDVRVGDIELTTAYQLSGRVVLADGKPIPEGMRLTISADRAWDSQTVNLAPDGGFAFAGLPAGVFSLTPSVKGYGLAEGFEVEVLVHRDVAGLAILLRPSLPKAAPGRQREPGPL